VTAEKKKKRCGRNGSVCKKKESAGVRTVKDCGAVGDEKSSGDNWGGDGGGGRGKRG